MNIELLPYLSLIAAMGFAAAGIVIGRKWATGEVQKEAELAQQQMQAQAEQQLVELQHKLAVAQQDIESLQQQNQQLDQNLSAEKSAHQQVQLEHARAAERLESQTAQQNKSQQELIELQQKIDQLLAEQSSLKSNLAQEKEARQQEADNNAEKLALLENNKQQLVQEFENLSHKIFNEKQKMLVEQNKEIQQQSKQGLDALLTPFKDQLEGLRKKVDDVYVNEAKDRAALKAQIGELHQLNKQITEEASALSKALRGEKKTQGNWGELVLETVLERSGLRQGEEYVREQSHVADDGQRYRPDVIINLPEGKHIVVDAKVSLNAYTDYVNAETDVERDQYLKSHIEAIRNHINGLSEKAYQKLPDLNSPDFVFMFMPVEPAFMLAFQHDEKLFNDAFERRIVVVTPTTLLATLRTVSNLWSIERRNRSTEKLAEQAAKVYDRLRIVVEKMEKLGTQMGTAQKTYDEAYSSLAHGRGNLVNTANNFVTLGVRVKKEIAKATLEKAQEEDLPIDVADELLPAGPEQDNSGENQISEPETKYENSTDDLFAES